MELLAHPFRLTGGRAPTVTDGSEAAHADAVARIVMTRQGELELVPAYGIPDPVFADPASAAGSSALAGAAASADLVTSVDVARVNACLTTFGPACQVALVAASRDARSQTLTLEVSPA